MRKSHAAGWAPGSPTPAQLKEFFGQIDTGKITKDSLQAFLRGDFVVSSPLTEAERMVQEILGSGKVFGYQEICLTWRTDLPDTEPTMLYTKDILQECAEANAAGEANWRFSYVTGPSLRSQREFIGWNRKKQPCFNPDWTWWLESQQDGWAKQAVEPGYRLFDFTNRYSNLRWDVQGERIAELGDQFERAEEQAVAEICFSTFLLNKGERLLPNWYHWGRLQTASGINRVCVGSFGQRGFDVRNWHDIPFDFLSVVLSRKSA